MTRRKKPGKEREEPKRPLFSFGGTGAFPPTSTVFGGLGAKKDGDGDEAKAATTTEGAGTATTAALPPAADAKTGEEGEDTVFSTEGVLFEFEQPSASASSTGEAAAAAGRWKERGRGELRLNVASADSEKESSKSSAARLVMRSRGLHRLLLNANLWHGMKASRMDGGRGATFAVVNAAAAEGGAADGGGKDSATATATAAASSSTAAAAAKLATYAFRCSSAAKLDEFLVAVEEHNKPAAAE